MGMIVDTIHIRQKGDIKEFLSGLYQASGMNYPKFFKMDLLSKGGILAAEKIFKAHPADEQTALVFANAGSSLDTDRQFQQTIRKEAFFPSPSVFVYTLPNIGMGEICIRHRIYGEQAFFISPALNAERLCRYTEILLESGSSQVLGGWMACDKDSCDIFAWLARPDGPGMALNARTITHLYEQ